MKTVNIKLIRHGESTANVYSKKNGHPPQDKKYRDAYLSPQGISDIISKHSIIIEKFGNPDYIFCSPLTRAIQTFLYTYEGESFNNNFRPQIFLLPLVSEIGDNLIENQGRSKYDLQNDARINNFSKFSEINFKENFYYDYGWKISGVPNQYWFNNAPLLNQSNIRNRMRFFKELLSNPIFTGKNIVIFTHSVFIAMLLPELGGVHRHPDNLEIIQFMFDQTTQKISVPHDARTILHNNKKNINKSIKNTN
jgi:broad specificity phosphatase PhoE